MTLESGVQSIKNRISIRNPFKYHFCPYPGTPPLVRMDSGRLAVVMEQNPGTLTRPIVKVFFSTRTRALIAPTVLDTSRSTDHIVARDSASNWGLKNLDELWAGDAVPARSPEAGVA